MERFWVWSKLRDNRKWLALSDREARRLIEAMCWTAEHEEDGDVPTAVLTERIGARLVETGWMERTDKGFHIVGWEKRQVSRAELQTERDAARERMKSVRRSRSVRPNKERSSPRSSSEVRSVALPPTSLSTSGVALEGSQLQPSRRRDEAFEALAEFWLGSWKGLPNGSRGRINEALAELRAASMNEGLDLADEIRIRGERAKAWQSGWEWTPQTLVRYWAKLRTDVTKVAKKDRLRLAAERIARQAEAEQAL